MVGTQIENYRIQSKLGEGGMGVVYKALDTNLDRVVAIKVLNSEMARDAGMTERFRSEARAQANLGHPNVATLYNFFVHQGDAIMVMEFVDGESLQQVLERRGPIPADEAVPLFRQALLGIGAAHRMGIVHRDIKPANLMINRTGLVKVMDFGIAKVAAAVRTVTTTGMQVGTPHYMSPEQVKGGRVDIRTDIYALGITLYELLTAHVPFFSDSGFQILSDHVNTPPPPPSKFYPYLSKELEAVVLKALEKDPEQRFQTVDDFGVALENPALWARNSRSQTAAETVKAPTPPPAFEPKAHLPAQAQPLRPQPQPAPIPQPVKRGLSPALLTAIIATLLGGMGLAGYMLMKGSPEKKDSPPMSIAQVKTPSSPGVSTANDNERIRQLVAGSGDDSEISANQPNKTSARSAANQLPKPTAATRRLARAPTPEAEQAAPPAVTPAPPAPQTQQPGTPAVSKEAMDEAQHRLMRLHSRASALHDNLEDLRRNLAAQGLSVRSEAVEAASNLDQYLQEADRALQSGDVAAANTNMDRADYTAKKLAGVVGG